MSRSKRRSDNTAPALFPFLAVLLCTIGALVLILVITVTNSHASARRDAELAMTEVNDTSDIMEVVSDELAAQRENLKTKVERRRRDLADIEDHIIRLKKNLEQLADKIVRIQSETSKSELTMVDKAEKVAELRKEIDAKKLDLINEIDKQKKRKPAFSVIPYVGTNGTSRRPVYLECTKDGVIVQPEGLLISLNDLKPPLGPGNPLDAALRVLRLAYQQRDTTFGITQPPYPLLLVRPDGIQTYALAREAMNGWDDQFGYELINADMDLKFPAGIPGLKEQLVGTIDTAKRRQQALIASMPRGRLAPDRDDDWEAIDSANNSQATGSNGSSPSGSPGFGGSGGSGGFGSSDNGASQKWQLVQGIANSQVSGAIQRNGIESENPASQANPNGQRNPQSPFGATGSPIAGSTDLNGQFDVNARQAQNGSMTPLNGQATNGQPPNGQPPSATDKPNANGNSGAKNRYVAAAAQGSALGNSGDDNVSGSSTGNSPSISGQTASNTQQGGSGSSSAMGAKTPSSSNTQSQQGANAFSSGSATGEPSNAMQPAGEPKQNASLSMSKNISSGTSVKTTTAPKAKHVNPDGDLKPISVTAGRGWAASRAEGKATPVSRPINVIALKDRWLLRSDSNSTSFDASITMEDGPQQAGNQLATAIRKRVDSWGLSLPGGFWSPTLTIEAANDAQQSVDRLERLLEGSGVEIKIEPLKLPNQR
ncbi:MAG: hypothetical protein NTU79_03620 [Planctomycetota bacterium]|nr:hypothetical protein [Planctomycetota bacterium]